MGMLGIYDPFVHGLIGRDEDEGKQAPTYVCTRCLAVPLACAA